MVPTEGLTRLGAALRDVTTVLNELQAQWALVGGLAVSARTEPRFTRDVDLAVAVESDPKAEALIRFLLGRGYRVLATMEHEEAERLSTVRLLAPAPGEKRIVVDILFASSGIEPELIRDADSSEVVPDFSVPIARVGHLLALKVLSYNESRMQDLVDIHALLREADDQELERARGAVSLITARGYNRGKDLIAELEAYIAKK